ncbi:hypothetical protein CP533_4712 [Ophiocordyceps camponoti-saundersi (nom. inval.)]|nr:hypothetical protein CP533_4712 [Ophiocordyceps camponoti-saundersi (nom. inval.)]
MDADSSPAPEKALLNTSISNISWQGISVTVKDRKTKQPKTILDNVDGIVKAGELCALMGPSGSGKTTLLNALAKRYMKGTNTTGKVQVNGEALSQSTLRHISCFVEQEEAFLGCLTVFETIYFASRLAVSSVIRSSKEKQKLQINSLLDSLGLVDHADTIIGTPLKKGISGGQKRRVGIGRQLITNPKILFLDEPTTGLDASAALEVAQYLAKMAKQLNLIVICSIHQPSPSTFNLFDKLALVSQGKSHYFGDRAGVCDYYTRLGAEISLVEPADSLLGLLNVDFARDKAAAAKRLDELQSTWRASAQANKVHEAILSSESQAGFSIMDLTSQRVNAGSRIATLVHRSFIKAYRDPLPYGVRVVFSVGFAILLGTVWLRLGEGQDSIQSRTGLILIGPMYAALVSPIYAPAIVEDYLQYVQDLHNGLYGAAEFVLVNFIVGIPFLTFIGLLFTSLLYWLSNLRPSPSAYFTWILWICLTMFSAESLVLLTASILPDAVFIIAFATFFNFLSIYSEGYFIPYSALNAFYKYGIHHWAFTTYPFQELMFSQFSGATFDCGPGCRCLYESDLAGQCKVAGEAVLKQFDVSLDGHLGRSVGISLAITLAFRLTSWTILKLKSR